MKVVTSEQMREADRVTIEQGTPGKVLMERAGASVVDTLKNEFSPLKKQRVVIFCGKGNNGGDGLVVARLLEGRVKSLQIVRTTDPKDVEIDPKANIVVDALLGTGFEGAVRGRYKDLIRAINEDFPKAKIVAVDIPSALQVRADITVTFAAPKVEMLVGEGVANVWKSWWSPISAFPPTRSNPISTYRKPAISKSCWPRATPTPTKENSATSWWSAGRRAKPAQRPCRVSRRSRPALD